MIHSIRKCQELVTLAKNEFCTNDQVSNVVFPHIIDAQRLLYDAHLGACPKKTAEAALKVVDAAMEFFKHMGSQHSLNPIALELGKIDQAHNFFYLPEADPPSLLTTIIDATKEVLHYMIGVHGAYMDACSIQ